MRWFRESKKPDIWDNNLPEPIDDLKAAQMIRRFCAAADPVQTTGRPLKAATECYERAVKAAMQIAMKISDDLIRDAALREIIGLCMKAKDVRRAEVLFGAIQSTSIGEAVLIDNPVLRK